MLFLQMSLVFVIGYLIAKTLTSTLERENEKLKQELVYVKQQRIQDKERYQDRIHMMNDAFNQYKKSKSIR